MLSAPEDPVPLRGAYHAPRNGLGQRRASDAPGNDSSGRLRLRVFVIADLLQALSQLFLNFCWEPGHQGSTWWRDRNLCAMMTSIEATRTMDSDFVSRRWYGGCVRYPELTKRMSSRSVRFLYPSSIIVPTSLSCATESVRRMLPYRRGFLRPYQDDLERAAADSFHPYSRRNSGPAEPASARHGSRPDHTDRVHAGLHRP